MWCSQLWPKAIYCNLKLKPTFSCIILYDFLNLFYCFCNLRFLFCMILKAFSECTVSHPFRTLIEIYALSRKKSQGWAIFYINSGLILIPICYGKNINIMIINLFKMHWITPSVNIDWNLSLGVRFFYTNSGLILAMQYAYTLWKKYH